MKAYEATATVRIKVTVPSYSKQEPTGTRRGATNERTARTGRVCSTAQRSGEPPSTKPLSECLVFVRDVRSPIPVSLESTAFTFHFHPFYPCPPIVDLSFIRDENGEDNDQGSEPSRGLESAFGIDINIR